MRNLAVINRREVSFNNVNDLAKSFIFDKMFEESATSMTNYLEGWVDTMDEVDGDMDDFTPYTVESVIPVVLGTLDNEVGTVKGRTIQLGVSPDGFYEALKAVINEMLLAEA